MLLKVAFTTTLEPALGSKGCVVYVTENLGRGRHSYRTIHDKTPFILADGRKFVDKVITLF